MVHFDLSSPVVAGIIFWLFIAAVSITPMVAIYKIRKATLDALRMAIEKGQDLPPEMFKQLSNIGQSMYGNEQNVSAINLKVGGVITMTTGAGIAIVATIFTFAVPVAAPFIYCAAAVCFCVGVGLYYGAKIMREHELEQKSNHNA